ncbi:geranylgeranyl transferase type-2 subunit alpha 1 [Canna indica]|uniref:Geranylgeranyl transferase type-2 subunit alpha n=1 Tax=Canna indica TaxID=4628 RepID=A0AAQ3KZF3_9LILI|nr:geranylgeranyl transferase type-2 subunit alpha 1 [Canna indica]
MHGRPRKDPRPKDAAVAAAKAANLRDLQVQLLHNHQNRIYTKEALAACSKLLEINPEVYTAWNYRKLALQHNLDGVTDPDAVKSAVNDELRIVEIALRTNPKSYGAWYHRKWVLSRQLLPAEFEREFRLLDLLLKADTRNFHGWNYRRFVANLKSVTEEEELKYTKKMIDINFSNYSAWHNRSALLSHVLEKDQRFEFKKSTLTEEYGLVHDALFTDQSDQSGWFYYLWLLDQTVCVNDPKLISSWPAHGSNLILSTSNKINDCQLFSSSKPSSFTLLQAKTFPIILYFNKAVKNVNSSTVVVSSMFVSNEDLTWRPLSIENSEKACCWVTFLKVPDEKCSGSSSYPIEVSLGRCKDTISSNGSYCKYPSEFTFTVTLKDHNSEQDIVESAEENVVWNYADACNRKENLYPLLFDQLSITEDHVAEDLNWNLQTLSNEIELFREFNDEDSKFVKLTLARLLVFNDIMMLNGTHSQLGIHSEEVLTLYDDLMKLDPSHKGFYEDERSVVLMDQLTSDKDSLIKRCWYFDKPTSSNFHHQSCLRLSNLSLTRIGSVKNLLWVQLLDLSHNKLRSVAGLEALQLIVCLNLSHNQIGSFTALESLKVLSSLRVLDVSFNKISACAIDTRRYLCSSPLSHTVDGKQIIEEYEKENTMVQDHWEVIMFLRALHLTQLDIKGNAALHMNFRGLAIELLPTLKWLDGERIR